MTKEKFASMITGREYPFHLTNDERALAKSSNLLVVYGASDDLCETDGTHQDETGAPGTVCFAEDGSIMEEADRGELETLEKFNFIGEYESRRRHAIQVDLRWSEDPYSWTLYAETEHATFEIVEDGAPFCRGIVIDLNEVAE